MGKEKTIYHAFTTVSNKLEQRLANNAFVLYEDKSVEVIALWDTGATCSCISSDVVHQLSLVATGKMNIHTPAGQSEVNTYLVDVRLPNNVTIKDIQVCDSDIGKQGIGLLIGMDIISLGDFTVSNYNGKTTFSFRTPSKQVTDYVKQINLESIVGTSHGKGKRKRKK